MAEGTFGAFLPGVDAAVRRALTELHRLIRATDSAKVDRAGDTMTGPLRLSTTTDVSLSSTGHAFQIGPDNGSNIAFDDNEIMARNNGATSDLHLNADGGAVRIANTSRDAALVVNGFSYIDADRAGTSMALSSPVTVNTAGTVIATSAITAQTTYPRLFILFGRLLVTGMTTTAYFDLSLRAQGTECARSRVYNGDITATAYHQTVQAAFILPANTTPNLQLVIYPNANGSVTYGATSDQRFNALEVAWIRCGN